MEAKKEQNNKIQGKTQGDKEGEKAKVNMIINKEAKRHWRGEYERKDKETEEGQTKKSPEVSGQTLIAHQAETLVTT